MNVEDLVGADDDGGTNAQLSARFTAFIYLFSRPISRDEIGLSVVQEPFSQSRKRLIRPFLDELSQVHPSIQAPS